MLRNESELLNSPASVERWQSGVANNSGNHTDALSVHTDAHSVDNESNTYWKTSGHSESEKSLWNLAQHSPTGTKKCRVGVMDDFGSLTDVLTIHIDAPSIGGKLKEQTDGASDAFQCLCHFIPQSQQTWHPAPMWFWWVPLYSTPQWTPTSRRCMPGRSWFPDEEAMGGV